MNQSIRYMKRPTSRRTPWPPGAPLTTDRDASATRSAEDERMLPAPVIAVNSPFGRRELFDVSCTDKGCGDDELSSKRSCARCRRSCCRCVGSDRSMCRGVRTIDRPVIIVLHRVVTSQVAAPLIYRSQSLISHYRADNDRVWAYVSAAIVDV